MAPHQRGWWRDKFYDHPLLLDPVRSMEARINDTGSDKTRCICKECFEHHVRVAQAQDQRELQLRARLKLRTREEIIDNLWAAPQYPVSGRCWLSSHVTTLINHLTSCPYSSDELRQQALDETSQKRGSRSHPPSRSRSHSPALTPPSYSPSPGLVQSLPGPSPLLFPHLTLQGAASTSSATLETQPAPPYVDLNSPPLNKPAAALPSTSLVNKRRRVPLQEPSLLSAPVWSVEYQRKLETSVARMVASTNTPLSWVDDPEVIAFFAQFLPWAQPISRRVLTSRLIPAELEAQRTAQTAQLRDAEATLQCDGWSAGNFHHYTGFTMTIRGDTVIVALEDNSGERKTGDNLYAMIMEKLHLVERTHHVRVVAFVSDSGGDSKKARRLLAQARPDLIVLPCYAHQTYLIVGDYFKCKADILDYAPRAEQVITWLRSKTYVLALLRNIQERVNPGAPPLSVVRAVLTRWTSHYLAYRRLLRLQPYLMTMIAQDEASKESQIITGTAAAKAKAIEIISHLKDSDFWRAIERMKSHLEPFAYAVNITQSDQLRLDTVLLVLGLLYNRFENLPRITPSDNIVAEAICNSINTRWEASDQDLFIAAVILNPTHKTRPFRKWRFFSIGLITVLMSRLYRRLFSGPAPRDLVEEVHHYLEGRGFYDSEHSRAYEELCTQPEEGTTAPTPLDPLRFWQSLSFPGVPPSPLTRIAIRLFSICPNSASCERLFSLLKRTMTSGRTRLTTRNLLNIAELHAHLREQQVKNGEAVQRLKRCLNPVSQTLHSLPQSNSASSHVGQAQSPVQPSYTPSYEYTSQRPDTPRQSEQAPVAQTAELHSQDQLNMSSEIADDSNTNLIDPPFDPDATLADMADILMKMVDDERLEKESLPMSDSQADSDSDTQTLAERSAEEDTPPARNKDATRDSDPDREGESTSSSSRNEGVLPLRLDFALLFNFSDRYWVSMVEDQAESGLADEAELCELLGQDGADPSMYTDI